MGLTLDQAIRERAPNQVICIRWSELFLHLKKGGMSVEEADQRIQDYMDSGLLSIPSRDGYMRVTDKALTLHRRRKR